MPRIFISYSRADRQFMETFIPFLRKSFPHIDFWYDDEIHGGADWWQMILNEIGQSDIFMYLMSNDSLESEYCRAEYKEALRLNKKILPVMIRPKTNISRLPSRLASATKKINWIDLSSGTNNSTVTASLIGSINKLVNELPATSPVPDDPTPTPEPPVPDKPVKAGFLADSRWQGVAALVAIAALAFTIYSFVSGSDDGDTPTTEPLSTEVANATDAPTLTLTPSDTPTNALTSTPTETIEVAFLVETLDAEATQAQETMNAQSTAAARATGYAEATQAIIDATNTATQWTDTPTPNITASIDAYRTEQAATATQAWIDSWTDTPTSTMTPTDTPTPTPTPDVTATLVAARFPNGIGMNLDNPVTTNSQWEPYSETFEGIGMVLVPAGCFEMGSEDGGSDETPVHEQCFEEPFWIDVTEVTRVQYQICVNEGVCEMPPDSEFSTEPDQPINRVTWFQSRDYCEWVGARLPTEREWEYAARGPDNLIYPWGDTYDASLVIGEDDPTYGDISTAPVGSRPEGASWVGALDMSGNVWEWVNTIYGVYNYDQGEFTSTYDYPYTTEDGREQDSEQRTDVRALRGGSFGNSSYYLRAAVRYWLNPNFEYYYFGFRCARSFK